MTESRKRETKFVDTQKNNMNIGRGRNLAENIVACDVKQPISLTIHVIHCVIWKRILS